MSLVIRMRRRELGVRLSNLTEGEEDAVGPGGVHRF